MLVMMVILFANKHQLKFIRLAILQKIEMWTTHDRSLSNNTPKLLVTDNEDVKVQQFKFRQYSVFLLFFSLNLVALSY